jgi:hypothetical protein
MTTNDVFDQGALGKLPDKEPGRHRWVVLATYTVPQTLLAAAMSGARVNLDHENRIGINAGCLDCEKPWADASGTRCDADAYDWDAAT